MREEVGAAASGENGRGSEHLKNLGLGSFVFT
jgi:hypothetical protein